jgi:hypothetical protein
MRHFWWLLVPAIAAVAAPACARPRDDALSSAFRCAAIADSRAWLDCYYGSAQPVRAALGMPPALAAQIKLATAPPAGGAPRDEAVRDEVMSASAGCIRAGGDRPWLDCYYAAAQPMRVQLGLSAPQVMTKSVPAPVPIPLPATQLASAAPRVAPAGPPPMPRRGGLFTGLLDNAKPIVRNMPMRSFDMDNQGAFTITLADGQVWRQSQEDAVYHAARWRKQASEMLVTIKPDAMSTFTMTVAGETRFYKVRRIR